MTILRGEMGREMGVRFGREGTWVYLWLILLDVWQKIKKKICKAIILQLKKIFNYNFKKKIGPCFLYSH